MSQFLNVVSPTEAIAIMSKNLSQVSSEIIDTDCSLGRVLSSDKVAEIQLPEFLRSSMDGYSVKASNTFGATEDLPAYLEVVGEIDMGHQVVPSISAGQAVTAYTGGMLADGADSVVMIEHTSMTGDGLLQVFRPVAKGENTIRPGEDFYFGDFIGKYGDVITTGTLGALLALGIDKVEVYRQLTVGVISSGDELVAPGVPTKLGQTRDINVYTIAAQIEKLGMGHVKFPLVEDNVESLQSAGMEALESCDALLYTSGSSLSSRDLTSQVIQSLGEPGVIAHGISVKPGKPTVLGITSGKPVIGLPGNPVSALTVFDFVVDPILRHISGRKTLPYQTVTAILQTDLPSERGRTDFVRVALKEIESSLTAVPIWGKSNSISVFSETVGYVQVSSEQSGLYKGTKVKVRLDV